MPQSMAHSQAGPVEYRLVGDGCETNRQIGSLLNGRKSMVLLFEPQADLVTGQALFVNSFPLSLAALLNSLLLPAELRAGWKFPANGPPGHPREPDYQAQPISIQRAEVSQTEPFRSPPWIRSVQTGRLGYPSHCASWALEEGLSIAPGVPTSILGAWVGKFSRPGH